MKPEIFAYGIIFGFYVIATIAIYVCGILWVTKDNKDIRMAFFLIWIIIFIIWQLMFGLYPVARVFG